MFNLKSDIKLLQTSSSLFYKKYDSIAEKVAALKPVTDAWSRLFIPENDWRAYRFLCNMSERFDEDEFKEIINYNLKKDGLIL